MKTEYKTEDEGPQTYSAGNLTEDGITFSLVRVEVHEGTFMDKNTGKPRPFYTAEGVDADGNEVSLAFGSKRLQKVLTKVLAAEGSPVIVNVAGHGEGFERNYTVKVVAD